MTRRTTVGDVMTTAVISVRPDTPFLEIATLLFAGAVRAVPVLDDEQRLVGVVSEADLLVSAEHGDAVRHRPRHTGRPRPVPKVGAGTARELMTAPAVTTDAATTVAEAARAMRKRHLSWMPVVDTEGRLVGVLGRSDLLAVFLRNDADIRAEIVDDVLLDILLVDPARVGVEVADGVVTLSGELDTHTDATLAVQFVERLEGVVRVVDRLTFETDAHAGDLDVAHLY